MYNDYKAEKYNPGFTLIELLVVISIIALLLSILMPSLGKARSSAMRIKCAAQLRQIGVACQVYAAANNELLPPFYDWSVRRNPPRMTHFGTYVYNQSYYLIVSKPYGAALANSGYLPNCDILYCPSDKRFKGRKPGELFYDSSRPSYHPNEMSYTHLYVTDDYLGKTNYRKFYRYKLTAPGKSVVAVDTGHWGEPWDNDPVWGYNAHEKGINLLKIDGSVPFAKGNELIADMELVKSDLWHVRRMTALDNAD